jgi:hypothetical protein
VVAAPGGGRSTHDHDHEHDNETESSDSTEASVPVAQAAPGNSGSGGGSSDRSSGASTAVAGNANPSPSPSLGGRGTTSTSSVAGDAAAVLGALFGGSSAAHSAAVDFVMAGPHDGAAEHTAPGSGQNAGASAGQALAATGTEAPVGASNGVENVALRLAASLLAWDEAGVEEALFGDQGRSGGGGEAASRREEAREIQQLAELLPINLAAVDRAIQHYLESVDGLGGVLSDLLTSDGASPWLMGIVVVSGCLLARRVSRDTKHEPLLSSADGSVSFWQWDLTSNEL